MWMMPLHLHVNQESDYDDDMNCTFIPFNLKSNAIPMSMNTVVP